MGGGVRAAAAEGSSWGQIDVLGRFGVTTRPADADHDVSHEEREVAGRMRVPLGIGSRQIAGRRGDRGRPYVSPIQNLVFFSIEGDTRFWIEETYSQST